MSGDVDRLRGKTRWSMAARCPRMAVYGLLGADPEPPDDPERQAGRFQRGKDAQRFHGRRLVARYGEDAVVPEKASVWPGPPALPVGELHTDFFVAPEKLAIEVKSSESESLFSEYLTQLAGQVYWDDEAESGQLVFLDRDYQPTATYPLVITDRWVEVLEETAAAVVEAGRTGELPPRTCEKASDARGKFCPFAGRCFEGWSPPLTTRADAAEAVAEAYLADRDLSEAKRSLKPLEERWEAARARLDELDLLEGRTVAGPVEVARTIVRPSERFSLKKAREAGFGAVFDDEPLASFVKPAAGHSRYRLRRISDDPLPTPGSTDEEAPF